MDLPAVDMMKPIDDAIQSRAWLAGVLGITRGAISQWDKVPANRIAEVARVTGLAPDVIRPDIFASEAV